MEKWKSIVGYEGLYEVSNYGKIRSLGRLDRHNHYHPPKEINQRTDKDGYLIVTLYDKQGLRKDCKAHRVVAFAFIPNPDNLPMINHKNEIRSANFVENLEWCTAKYNSNYGTSRYKRSIWQKGIKRPEMAGENNYFYGKSFKRGEHPGAKKVYQYDLSGKFLHSYDCVRDAAEAVGVCDSAISSCCCGRHKTSKGYIWEYDHRGGDGLPEEGRACS